VFVNADELRASPTLRALCGEERSREFLEGVHGHEKTTIKLDGEMKFAVGSAGRDQTKSAPETPAPAP
jgi:hypothetical protein